MILNRFVRSAFFLACAAATASAQDLLAAPVERWSYQLLPQANVGSVEVQKGNGVFLDPSGRMAVVTTVGASVYAFDAYSGSEMWQYQAPADGTSVASCRSAVTFSPSETYMVFSVVDNENSLTPTTRVIALDMGGNQIWASDSLDGIPQGDPLISSDGGYVFLTHNEFDSEAGISTGHFTILEGNTTGMVFYTDATDDDRAFGPPGIFHSPVEGNYDPIVSGSPVSEGENNSNDFIMWSQTPKPSDTAISNGFMYGFQFPRTFDGSNSTGIGFFELGELEVDFQSTTPPVITNEGLSAYWGVTRSSYRGWNNKRFSRARDNAVGFERNVDFAGEAVFAAPALSNDGPDPIIFGGSASTEFVRMTIDFETVIVRTQDLIMSKAIVDGEERAVYYVEMNGNLHQANVDTLVDNWNFTVNFAVEGEMALTPNNDVLIVADRRGVIRALEVAEIAVTEAPSDMPSDMPSMAPSGESVPTAPVAPTAPAPTADVDATPAPVSSGDTDAPVTGTDPPASGANQPMMVIAAVAGFAGLFI